MKKDSSDESNELASNPELLKSYIKVMAERYARAANQRQASKPRAISGSSRPRLKRLTLVRVWLFRALMALTLITLVDCFILLPFGWLVAVLVVITALSVFILIFQEVVLNAGTDVQTQYREGDSFFREFEFVPSMRSLNRLMLYLSGGVIAIVIGFAALYSNLSWANLANFDKSEPVHGIASIYFSVVTFATVGYGDISPVSQLTRSIVVLEITCSIVLLTILITTIVSWVSSNQRELQQELIRARAQRVEEVEAFSRRGTLWRH